MAANVAQAPLVSIAVPQSGPARLVVQILLVIGGSLLLWLSARAKVVLGPVDLSLQTLAVLLIAAAYGFRLGVSTLALYLAQGAAGLPVFQSTPEKGIGLAYMVGPTGGYLLGFLAMAAIVGWAVDRGWGSSIVKLLAAMLVAEIVMMAMGFAWLAYVLGVAKAWEGGVPTYLALSWQYGVAPFIVPDLIKVVLASLLVPAATALIKGGGR
jgi:biotin transport system substrate-specific component